MIFYPVKILLKLGLTVANIKSALKRIQITERNRLHNRSYKSASKTFMKKYFTALDAYASEQSSEAMEEVRRCLSAAYSKIDKSIKRGVLHPNTGARQKARMVRALKQYESAAS